MQAKPLLVYDGDCNFCCRWIERWRLDTGDRVDYAPYQEAQVRYPEIPLEEFKASVQLIEQDLSVTKGAKAVFKALGTNPRKRWLLWAYEKLPGFRFVSETFYQLVAQNRVLFSSITRFFWGEDIFPSTFLAASWIFLRALGLIYVIAFASLGTQVLGLIGSHGILPAKQYLDSVHAQMGGMGYWFVPTLAWLSASDLFLKVLCWGGAFAGLLVFLDVAGTIPLIICWAFYLSLVAVGQDFLSFQWDALLLESGFLAIFLFKFQGPGKSGLRSEPSFSILMLFRWLLFRLMYSSGAVKLLSGDPVWHNFTALQYHYFTQPLPTWTSWYMHQLPAAFHQFSTGVIFFIELIIPFFIFLPRRFRMAGAGFLILFQVILLATGNYAFFNWLTISLCLLLVDDRYWPQKFVFRFSAASERKSWPRIILIPVLIILWSATSTEWCYTFRKTEIVPTPALVLHTLFSPFRSANRYGLFAVMTTTRPEINLEGSEDGKLWLPYEFKYKPGDMLRKPRFVAPHQPRLDWQMWFAALSPYQYNAWFLNFCERLFENSHDVVALLAANPFWQHPPRYLRATVYDYEFSSFDRRRLTGKWWSRRIKGPYCPVITKEKNVES